MSSIVLDTENFVVTLFNEKLDNAYVYHNLSHTKRVVTKTQELIDGMQIPENEALQLILAAWLHDTGYINGAENHEEKSVEIASKFLKEQGVSKNDITTIGSIIMATKMGYKAQTLQEKIIRDADCSHLGSKNFDEFLELLRKEWELSQNKVLTDSNWIEENINFLTKHHKFYTNFSLSNWEKQKGKNLAQLLKSQKKLNQEQSKLKQKKDELQFKKSKVELPERGIETMFRVALRNHKRFAIILHLVILQILKLIFYFQ